MTEIVKKVREKSRECHNHKPQPILDMKRKRKQNARKALSLPQRGNRSKPQQKHRLETVSKNITEGGGRGGGAKGLHFCLASHKSDINKKCRHRSETTESGI